MLKLSLLTIVCVLLSYHKADAEYDMFLEEAEIVYVSPEFFNEDECSSEIVEDDDENTVLNMDISIVQDLSLNMDMEFNLFGRSPTGDYAIPTGVSLRGNLCDDVILDTTIVGPVFASFNVSSCPIQAGLFTLRKYKVNTDVLPSTLPPDYYKAVVKIMTVEDDAEDDDDTDVKKEHLIFHLDIVIYVQ